MSLAQVPRVDDRTPVTNLYRSMLDTANVRTEKIDAHPRSGGITPLPRARVPVFVPAPAREANYPALQLGPRFS